MLAGTADRDRTVELLGAAYTEGRLSKEEYDQRLDQALSARSMEDLRRLTADLPRPPRAGFPQPRTMNNTAVAAMICGIAATMVLITAIPALVLGYRARGEIRRTGQEGDGFAVAGIILGWIFTFVMALCVLAVVLAVALVDSSGM